MSRGDAPPETGLELMKWLEFRSTSRTNSRTRSRKSRAASSGHVVQSLHCQAIRQSIELNPNEPAGRATKPGLSSWHRRPCVLVAGEVDAGVFTKFVEAVVGLDDADSARLGPHHDRLGVRATSAVADTAQQIA